MSGYEHMPRERFVDDVRLNGLGAPFNDERVAGAFFDLASQLALRFADYDLVLGDDTSGRLAAIVMHRVASNIRLEENLPKPALRFAASAIAKHAHKPGFITSPASPDSRVLIVSEGIASGGSVEGLGRIIAKGGRAMDHIDVACIGTFDEYDLPNPIEGASLYIGDTRPTTSMDSSAATLLRGPQSRRYKGVAKSRSHFNVVIDDEADRGEINRTRIEAKDFGDLLVRYAVVRDMESEIYPIVLVDKV